MSGEIWIAVAAGLGASLRGLATSKRSPSSRSWVDLGHEARQFLIRLVRRRRAGAGVQKVAQGARALLAADHAPYDIAANAPEWTAGQRVDPTLDDTGPRTR